MTTAEGATMSANPNVPTYCPTILFPPNPLALYVPGVEKRDLIGSVIAKVMPTEDGAEIIYLPGVFGSDTLQTNTFVSGTVTITSLC